MHVSFHEGSAFRDEGFAKFTDWCVFLPGRRAAFVVRRHIRDKRRTPLAGALIR
jgi:hypothetical protein